jgi:hypothetical protein
LWVAEVRFRLNRLAISFRRKIRPGAQGRDTDERCAPSWRFDHPDDANNPPAIFHDSLPQSSIG